LQYKSNRIVSAGFPLKPPAACLIRQLHRASYISASVWEKDDLSIRRRTDAPAAFLPLQLFSDMTGCCLSAMARLNVSGGRGLGLRMPLAANMLPMKVGGRLASAIG
jgi:hypothetical protein